MTLHRISALTFVSLFVVSCGDSPPASPAAESEQSAKTPVPAVKAVPAASSAPAVAPQFWSEVKLHELVRAANPGYSGNGQFQIDLATENADVVIYNVLGKTVLNKKVSDKYIKSILWPDLPPDQTGLRKLRSFFINK